MHVISFLPGAKVDSVINGFHIFLVLYKKIKSEIMYFGTLFLHYHSFFFVIRVMVVC